MLDAESMFFEVDDEPLQDAVQVCMGEIARVGDDLAGTIHGYVFGFRRDEAPWHLYYATQAEGAVITLVPSWRLLKFIVLLRRSGRC